MLFQEMSSSEKMPPTTETTPNAVSSPGRLSQQISAKRCRRFRTRSQIFIWQLMILLLLRIKQHTIYSIKTKIHTSGWWSNNIRLAIRGVKNDFTPASVKPLDSNSRFPFVHDNQVGLGIGTVSSASGMGIAY